MSDEDAEDVFQDVSSPMRLRPTPTRRATTRPRNLWIAQLTRRLCLDSIARGSREQPAPEQDSRNRRDDFAEIEEAFEVREAVTTLPEACQEILDRFFARDQSYKTISSELDIPAGTDREPHRTLLGKLRDGSSREEVSPLGV